MYSQKIALALTPLFLLARADLQLDNDDVPTACSTICRPIVELTRLCEVDLRGDNNDITEERLEAQCICTNDSFDVSEIAGSCAGCIYANRNANDNDDDDDDDDDDNDNYDVQDIDEILYTCGWSRGSWNSNSAPSVSGITVDATAPTASSQLTTTIVPGATATKDTTTTSTGTATDDNSDDSTSTSTDSSSGSTSTSDSNSDNSNNDDNDDNDNAASALAPLGIAGAAVAVAALLLA